MALDKSVNSGFHNLFHLHVDKEMMEVAVFQLFRYLGRNFVVLALPFYMYTTLGYALWQICMYYVFFQGAIVVTSPFVISFLRRFGIKHSISTGRWTVILFWLALSAILPAISNYWLAMLAMLPAFLIMGFGGNLQNVAYDIFLTHHMNKGKKGKALAWIQIAVMGGAIVAPILGGLVTAHLGFQQTVYFAVLFHIIAGVVLLLTPDQKFRVPYSSKELVSDALHHTPIPLFLAEFGRIFYEGILWIVWPIFLMVVLKDIISIGVVAGISAGIAMLVAYFVGHKIDKQAQERGAAAGILRNGAYRSVFLNFLRGIWWDPIFIGAISSLNRINNQTIRVPYDIEFYKWMHRKHTFERSHIRQIAAEGIYTLSALIFAGTFYFTSAEQLKFVFIGLFVLSAVSLILCGQISKVGEGKKY